MKRFVVLCGCLLAASSAFADPIVTWTGSGTIGSNSEGYNFFRVAPVGTPVSWTVSFDPSQQAPTQQYGGTISGCMTVPVTGSVTIGGYTFTTGSPSIGYTNASLPGTNCGGLGRETQFSMHTLMAPPDNPWPLYYSVLFISYRDLLMRDAFPDVPTAPSAQLFLTDVSGQGGPSFTATTSIGALDLDPAPVPEPASVTLLGLGLAAAYRKVRGARA
jgi:hypothetical protein